MCIEIGNYMRAKDIRNWLGLYFLIITSVLGAYILLTGGSPLLPMERKESLDTFEIIIPVLIGQLTIIFQWFGGNNPAESNQHVDIPSWVIKGPPIIVAIILLLAILVLVMGNWGEGKQWTLSPDGFKGVVTFCVSLLNATTISIISRFFKPGG